MRLLAIFLCSVVCVYALLCLVGLLHETGKHQSVCPVGLDKP